MSLLTHAWAWASPILAGYGAAAFACSLLVLVWIIQYEVAESRRAKRERKNPAQDAGTPPQDGRPLNEYENFQLALIEDGLQATPWWENQ